MERAARLVTSSMRRQRQPARLRCEPLEPRCLPTSSKLVLDFTPDPFPGEWRLPGFAQEFARWNGPEGPRFLDFNRNGRVNSADAELAARAISARVHAFFRSLPIQIVAGDFNEQAQLGKRLLEQGQASDEEYVAVIYVGGAPWGNAGIWGEAYQAPLGHNHEHYAFVYSAAIARWMAQANPDAGPGRFRDEVALTIAHEAGHLMGLGHVKDHPPSIPSVMNYSVDPSRAGFINRAYVAEVLRPIGVFAWGRQNPFQELRRSLAGQPNAFFYGTYAYRAPASPSAAGFLHREGPGVLQPARPWVASAELAMADPHDSKNAVMDYLLTRETAFFDDLQHDETRSSDSHVLDAESAEIS
jgi:predicted Zn-dependent protease